MGAFGIVKVVAVIAALVLVALFTLYRRRDRRPDLVVHLTAPVIKPVNNRPEWYLDFVAEFANVSPRALSVTGLRATVSTPKQALLDAKRMLGDDESQHHAVAHPPDIALRLPIQVAPGHRVSYRFHIFFSVHLRRMWDSGLLHLYATDDDGIVYEAVRVLTAPENESGIPPGK
jgi:hypothetical protein